METPIEHELLKPIKVGDEEITKLVIKRRPTTKDLKVMDRQRGEVAKAVAFIARMTGVPPSSIDQLDGKDFTDLQDIVNDFLE